MQKKIYSAVFLAAVTVLGLGLRLPGLDRNLWYDEVMYSTTIPYERLGELVRICIEDKTPPLYRGIMFLWVRMFGDSEVSVRIPSVIAGTLSILLIYLLALRFLAPGRALVVSCLLSVSPVYICYSREATPYAVTQALMLAAFALYYDLQANGYRALRFAGYCAAAFCAAFTNWSIAVFLIPGMFVRRLNNEPDRKIPLANSVILISVLAAIVFKSVYGSMTNQILSLKPFTIDQWWMTFFNYFLFGNSLWNIYSYGSVRYYIVHHPELLYAQLFFLVIFARGFVVIVKEGKTAFGREIAWFLFALPLAGVAVSAFGVRHVYTERYLLAICPFFLIVLTRGSFAFRARWMRIAIVSALVLSAGVSAVNYFQKREEEWTVRIYTPDWRSAVRFFQGEVMAGARAVPIIVTSPLEEFLYAERRLQRAAALRGVTIPQLMLYERNLHNEKNIFKAITRKGAQGFYLIENETWERAFHPLFEALANDERFFVAGSKYFKGIRIVKYGPRQ